MPARPHIIVNFLVTVTKLTMSDSHILIEVEPEFLPSQSEPENDRYVFAYHIQIRNEGEKTVQLLRRYWCITDANGDVSEVRGEGVVGEQPHIRPGGMHAYSSFCILATPVGVMQGSYTMVTEAGDEFEAEIPLFRLAVPGTVN